MSLHWSFVTALCVTEILYGRPSVLTNLEHSFDQEARRVRLTGAGDVGQTANTIFLGLAQTLCGAHCFHRMRLQACPCQSEAEAGAYK